MTTMRVVPGVGRTVPDPERGDLLPPEGREVPKNQYWMRRLLDQDVVKQTAARTPTVTDKKGA